MRDLESFLNHLMEGLPPPFSLLLVPLQSIFSPCFSPAQELLSFLPTSYHFPKLPVPKCLQAIDIFILPRLLYPLFAQTGASQTTLSLGWSLGDLGSIPAPLCPGHQRGFLLLCPFLVCHVQIGSYSLPPICKCLLACLSKLIEFMPISKVR